MSHRLLSTFGPTRSFELPSRPSPPNWLGSLTSNGGGEPAGVNLVNDGLGSPSSQSNLQVGCYRSGCRSSTMRSCAAPLDAAVEQRGDVVAFWIWACLVVSRGPCECPSDGSCNRSCVLLFARPLLLSVSVRLLGFSLLPPCFPLAGYRPKGMLLIMVGGPLSDLAISVSLFSFYAMSSWPPSFILLVRSRLNRADWRTHAHVPL